MNRIEFALSASALFIVFVLSCSSNGDDDLDFDTFKDLRDGQTYKWVKIGNQTWMAENLNYKVVEINYNIAGSKCFDNDSRKCKTYGRLYDWETAVDACPDGWHLPTDEEWQELIDFAGGDDIAGKKLRANKGWSNNSGTDDYGFSALPGGFGTVLSNGVFYLQAGKYANWWSITEYNSVDAYERNMDIIRTGYEDKVTRKNSAKERYMQSVRCVKNDDSYYSLFIGDLNSDGGTFTDVRDGREYKWVEIGSKTWTAENLNYDIEGSKCYDDKPTNCEKYGRLYDWFTARTVCPDGWHLPGYDEWEALIAAVGGKSTAGIKLKTADGWMRYPVHKGTDNYNFSALPGGRFDKHFTGSEYNGYWWSTAEHEIYDYYNYAYSLSIHNSSSSTTLWYFDKEALISVRCVKGSENDFSGTFTDARDGQEYGYIKIGTQTWMAENLNYDSAKYDWETALDVCPKDWHLPSYDEWKTLIIALGGPKVAGAKLKAKEYGFSALLGVIGKYGAWWSSSEYEDDTYAIAQVVEPDNDAVIGSYDPKSLALSVRCLKD